MSRHPRITLIAVLAWACWALGSSAAGSPDPDCPPEAGIPIFLKPPDDLNAFWERLRDPDFVILKGDAYRKLLDGARPGRASTELNGGLVTSVSIVGEVVGEFARLRVEYRIAPAGPGLTWVAIGLDGLALRSAESDGGELPTRIGPGGRWEVELRSESARNVRVDLVAPVRSDPMGRRVELAIPEAASTSIRIDVGPRIADARLGPDEPLAIVPIDSGRATRLAARISPRSKVAVSWRAREGGNEPLPPLLAAQGQIAVDVDPSAFRARSSWVVTAVRGSTSILRFHHDPADEPLEIELDGHPIPIDAARTVEPGAVTIALSTPLSAGNSARVTLATRRPLNADPASRVVFRGFPLAGARSQSGPLAIAKGGDLWVVGHPVRGLRRIDPRSELPDELRNRPATVLAYRFDDQPFELDLQVETPTPWVRVDSRTAIRVEPTSAQVETWLDYQVARGRSYDLDVAVPEGLDLISAGPPELVASTQLERGDDPTAQRLIIRLTPKARDDLAFQIQLVGRQAIEPNGAAALRLFAARGVAQVGGRLAIRTAPEIVVDQNENGWPAEFAEIPPPGPSAGPWPGGLDDPPAIWLRHDASPTRLALRVAARTPGPQFDLAIEARVGRDAIVVEQDFRRRPGAAEIRSLIVEVPDAIQPDWRVEGVQVVARERLKSATPGGSRHRLVLARDLGKAARPRFWYRVAIRPGLIDNRPTRLDIPWIRPGNGPVEPPRLRVTSEPGVDLAGAGIGWSTDAAAESSTTDSLGRLVLVRDGPAPVVATARALADLPEVVALRLFLRTELTPEGDLRTVARYLVEAGKSVLEIELPRGAVWSRAIVGGLPPPVVARVGSPSGFRVRWAPKPIPRPVDVQVEYTVPTQSAGSTWDPPRLRGGVVQQTYWEIRLPWSLTILGVPHGWGDENSWAWEGYVWRRRPRVDPAMLAAWSSGLADAPADASRGAAPDPSAASAAFLFGRAGPPVPLKVATASRAWLLPICSGIALLMGTLVLIWKPRGRLVGLALAGSVLAAAATVELSLIVLALQSSVLGWLLTFLAAVTQRVVDRRRSAGLFPVELAPTATGPRGSSIVRTAGFGSDDSTEVRQRLDSTRSRVGFTGIDPDVAKDESS